MTTLSDRFNINGQYNVAVESNGMERREYRRHNMEHTQIGVERWDGTRRTARTFGQLVDISAGGIRIRTTQANVRTDNQIRVRLELPEWCGIQPFVDATSSQLKPKREWVGWMTVNRVVPAGDGQVDVCGRLVDMDDIDRGMLGLYLSTQPLAA